MNHCGNCAHYDHALKQHTDVCAKCETVYKNYERQNPSLWEPLPITNADRIRSMSDEEIADWVSENGAIKTPCDIICGGDCKAIATIEKSSIERCKEIVMEWLQQPAEGE